MYRTELIEKKLIFDLLFFFLKKKRKKGILDEIKITFHKRKHKKKRFMKGNI